MNVVCVFSARAREKGSPHSPCSLYNRTSQITALVCNIHPSLEDRAYRWPFHRKHLPKLTCFFSLYQKREPFKPFITVTWRKKAAHLYSLQHLTRARARTYTHTPPPPSSAGSGGFPWRHFTTLAEGEEERPIATQCDDIICRTWGAPETGVYRPTSSCFRLVRQTKAAAPTIWQRCSEECFFFSFLYLFPLSFPPRPRYENSVSFESLFLIRNHDFYLFE